MKKIVFIVFAFLMLTTAMIVGIRPVAAEETIYIRSDGSVEGTDKIQREGNLYTFTDNIVNQSIVVEKDDIVIDGAGYTIQGIGSGIGVDLTERTNVTIKNTGIKAFGYCILINMSSNIVIFENTIGDVSFTYEYSCEYGIVLEHSSNTTISGNSIHGHHQYFFHLNGIQLSYSSNNIISENSIYDDWWCGIRLDHSSNTTISENNIRDNEYGIMFSSSSNNTISRNTMTNVWLGHHAAIQIGFDSNYNKIYGNHIAENLVGVGLEYSSNNTIFGNTITDNDGAGIDLRFFSDYNRISGNTITNNKYGVWLDYSSNNTIYHNNFIDNTQQVYDYSWDNPDNPHSTNVWDDGYPSGGNYWSNYTGIDLLSGLNQNETGSDGIGDTPHDIDTGNQDGYPLIDPISFFNTGTWNEINYYFDTVSNSTISDFNFNTDDCLISFNVTGADDTVGFCRVTIPRQLLWCDVLEEWSVMVDGNPPIYLKAMEDADNTYLYFNYSHSIQNVQIEGIHVIPEFPTWTSMLLVLILIIVATHVCMQKRLKKRSKTNKSSEKLLRPFLMPNCCMTILDPVSLVL